MKRTHDSLRILALPLALIAAAYVAICVQAGSALPLHHVCHEGGQRTLLTTIFYFQHAVRELPMDLVLAVAVAGAIKAFLPAPPPGERSQRGTPQRAGSLQPAFAGMAAMAVCATMLLGSAAVVGGSVTAKNLSQMYTRPGAELDWGAHWRYHLLSRFALILMAFVLAGLYRAWRNRRFVPLGDTSLYRIALFLFLTLTLVFRPTLEPFLDTLFLGHQARELATHFLITLPLALGAGLWVIERRGQPLVYPAGPSSFKPLRGLLVVAVLIGAWLAVGVLVTGAAGEGQTSSLTALLAGHVFEHAFGYAVVPLSTAALCTRLAPARVPALVPSPA